MTAALDGVPRKIKPEPTAEQRAAEELVRRARATGQVEIEVPRDRDGTFEPQIVRKRQRRLTGVDEMVLSLCAKGLTTGEVHHPPQSADPSGLGKLRR